ncbi:MAG: UTP--glucose-1-phosphate uridylyltransferase [Chitinivibrionales bacterium]|nr:UTP--glucose-1-phosphate uridylyltransferase [Chitinivibrionales bacterium]
MSDFSPFELKMKQANLPQIAIDMFRHYYTILSHGQLGFIRENALNPVKENTIADATKLASYNNQGLTALTKTIIIKLNGGLGTSMGLNGPKCLIPVKNNLSFLDILANQIIELRKKYNAAVPLLLMNSFNTHEKSVAMVQNYPSLQNQKLPATFLQHKFPKILQTNLQPATYPQQPEYEWNPPGHGDIYASLLSSGILDLCLDNGITYAFISNIDNLGATLDIDLLGYFACHPIPFLMEVAQRNEQDKKGGHLAQLADSGRMILRERAQAAPEDIAAFEDIGRYCFFNTNTIWINLAALRTALADFELLQKVPIIANQKHLVADDGTTPKVYQIETAMGSAISLFAGATAVKIPKSRFKPVKKCDDLLLLQSDRFLLTENFELLQNPACTTPQCIVTLDQNYFGTYQSLKKRFPFGIPSLLDCSALAIQGDVVFGKNCTVKGAVKIRNGSSVQKQIADNTIIDIDVTL